MELRVLQYFLAVAREQNITAAAESLHLSQPTLSRQLMDLEHELGKPLLVRGGRRVTLTEEGMLLRKRAEEIVELVRRAESEVALADEGVAGELRIGAGEADGMRLFARVLRDMRARYPGIRFHLSSGNAIYVLEQLERGLLDFGLIFGDVDTSRYEALMLPVRCRWGVLMRRDSPLASLPDIRPADLHGLPLLLSQQELIRGQLSSWMGVDSSRLDIVTSYNLMYNASLLVEEGVGYAIGFDGIINVTGDSPLCFRPLTPALELGMQAVWKKYQVRTRAADLFLQHLRDAIRE